MGTAACWQGVKRAGVHCRGPWPSSQSKTRNQQAQRPATSNQQKSRDRNTLLPEFSPPQAKAPCSWHTPWALRLSRELKSLPRGAGDPMVWGGVPELPIQEACSIVLLSTTEFWGPAGVSASPVPGDLSDHPSGSLQSTSCGGEVGSVSLGSLAKEAKSRAAPVFIPPRVKGQTPGQDSQLRTDSDSPSLSRVSASQ